MIKRIAKHGNGRALTLDRAMLELLNITDDTELKITTDGKGFSVYPVDPEQETEFQKAKERSLQRQKRTIKALADK
jgi:antitoxin component of MazEF toxin-antitoxin module